MPPADPAVLLLRGAVVDDVDVVFLCFKPPPELGALPAPLGAADLDPTVVDDAGAGCWRWHEIRKLIGFLANLHNT